MPFSENIKCKVKERAHYRCCLCRRHWVSDVHHIVPESEDGPNTEENAAPLCANCHDLYGGNPNKRKFIKESRDFWYCECEKSSESDVGLVREIHEHVKKNVVTKEDLQQAVNKLDNRIQYIINQPISTPEKLIRISDATNVATSAFSSATCFSPMSYCPKCGQFYDDSVNKYCPNCDLLNLGS